MGAGLGKVILYSNYSPNVKPDLLDFQIRFKVQLLAASKVSDVHPLLRHFVNVDEQVPRPLD